MTQSFPPPPIKPLERQQVEDGLLMNAERWRRVQEYHHKRQNIHYQSLNQPGIVCGLDVRLIPAPTEISAQYRDGRWLQVQPGIAIDLIGNPIVVPEPIDYRIASENLAEEPVMVYLVVSYVDPERLRRKEQPEIVQETFRLDERISPPGELEVELCRILLSPNATQLENSTDVFFPGFNNLDLRYRKQARSRPRTVVRVAQINPSPAVAPPTASNLSYLLQSVPALYPALEGADEVGQVDLQPGEKGNKLKLLDYELLYLNYHQAQFLKERQWETLRQYLELGGVLLVEASTEGTHIKELTAVEQELKKALAEQDAIASIANLELTANTKDTEFTAIRQELETELASVKTELDEKINSLCLSFQDFAQNLGTSLQPLQQVKRNHPLRTQPFLFAALPTINEQPIQISVGGGIVFVIGSLSSAWGLDEELLLPRETIRTAQEMGINILHFAWRRRQMMQSLPLERQAVLPEPSTPSRKQRSLKSILDKLD